MGRGEWSLDKMYKSLFQNGLNRFYQMSTLQQLQFLKKFNNKAVMRKGNKTLYLWVTQEDSEFLYLPYPILVEIFKEADELVPDGIEYAPWAPNNVKVVKNTQNVMELIIVIFNRDNGLVKCKSACNRFKAYNICKYSLSVAENEVLLQIKTDFYSIWNKGSLFHTPRDIKDFQRGQITKHW